MRHPLSREHDKIPLGEEDGEPDGRWIEPRQRTWVIAWQRRVTESPSQLLKEFLGAGVSGLGQKMLQAEGPVRGFLKENAPLEWRPPGKSRAVSNANSSLPQQSRMGPMTPDKGAEYLRNTLTNRLNTSRKQQVIWLSTTVYKKRNSCVKFWAHSCLLSPNLVRLCKQIYLFLMGSNCHRAKFLLKTNLSHGEVHMCSLCWLRGAENWEAEGKALAETLEWVNVSVWMGSRVSWLSGHQVVPP